MLTQDARYGDDMRPFHDRQPVFLDAARARCGWTPGRGTATCW